MKQRKRKPERNVFIKFNHHKTFTYCIIIALILAIWSLYCYISTKDVPNLWDNVSVEVTSSMDVAIPQPLPVVRNRTKDAIDLEQSINIIKEIVRTLRKNRVVMSSNGTAIAMTSKLQNMTRCYLLSQYGPIEPYKVEMILRFPESMTKKHKQLAEIKGIGKIVIEMAPIELLPHAVYTSNVQADFKGGVVYMEYDRRHPHVKHTLGFAGRGGGNAFYINSIDNTVNHGPGTDRGGKDPEADTNFGRIAEGEDIVYLMQKQPVGKDSKMGFIHEKENYIIIESLTLIKPTKAERFQAQQTFDMQNCPYTY